MALKNPIGGFVLILVCFFSSCFSTKKLPVSVKDTGVVVMVPVPPDSSRTDAFFEEILKLYPHYFDSILKNRKDWNVQIIYTQVDKGANGFAALKTYYFNLTPGNYFYPASAVKLPVTMLALQKLNELKINGLNLNTTMITEQADSRQSPVYNDPTTPSGKPTIAHYIKKILMVSDNEAYNRLYEFLGSQYINDELHKKGYGDAQLLHRLNTFLSPYDNKYTNPVKFFDPQNKAVYYQPLQHDTTTYPQRNDSLGKGYYTGVNLVNEPMEFSNKNRISLEDLHTILISLVFPNKLPHAQRFDLTAGDRNFLLKYMSQLPTESTFPPYSSDANLYWPAYCKFLLFGSEKGPLPKNLRIFNKAGEAYGQLTDVAYIVDLEKKIEFFLSATIYCNKDGIINDDQYDYETIGLPFMKQLGQAIFEHELKRKRKVIPDLSGLIFKYDRNPAP